MNSTTTLHANERSEGSELISEMNLLFEKCNLKMRKAVGELSLKSDDAKDGRNKTLFPDVIIFADKEKLRPLMGWELKMPDISIDDVEFISNAKDKADRLGTGVFVLWNFTYAAIYFRNDKGNWNKIPKKIFNRYSDVLTDRKSVQNNQLLWKSQLEEVLLYLNTAFISNKFNVAPISFNISNYVNTITTLLTPITAKYIENLSDTRLKKYVEYWVSSEKAELDTVKTINNFEKSAIAFSKSILMKWINRILFAHLLRQRHNGIYTLLVNFSNHKDILLLKQEFNEVVNYTDFYTILYVNDYEAHLPREVVESLNEFNLFLANTDFSAASMEFISGILESMVDTSKRELMGLYTTPKRLAKLLVNLTIEDSSKNYADLTVGSGTIVRSILEYISTENSATYAHDNIWAADKFSYPLQIANLAMTTPESINLKNIVFQEDALNLYEGKIIEIVDPSNGIKQDLHLPKFNYIISNLPFVSSNNRVESNSDILKNLSKKHSIDLKSDLYQFLILKFKDLVIEDDFKIGVITSNSWLKTQKHYKSFFNIISEIYDIEYIVCSNSGRWFRNAEVVTLILILKQKTNIECHTKFISLNINPVTSDGVGIERLTQEILFNSKSNLCTTQEYTKDEIQSFINMGMSLEALFDNVLWINNIKQNLVCMNDIFDSSRGVRTGADNIFITDTITTDEEYSYPILKNVTNILNLTINSTENYYFYTRDSIDIMKEKGNIKTIDYIDSISTNQNSLKRKEKTTNWYMADQRPQYADFVTSINPEKRFFWAKFETQTVVNQRVTAFRVKDNYRNQIDLIHALLNTSLSLYLLMCSGFGRGLGVTDLTKDGISQSYFLNPNKLTLDSQHRIMNSWNVVKNKTIQKITDQLRDSSWTDFNKVVYKEFGFPDNYYDVIKNNIVSLLNRRLSAKED